MIPPAALFVPDYIDEAAGAFLIEQIDTGAWLGDLSRRVQHHGFRYDYKARRVTADSYLGPLPDWLALAAKRLADAGLFERQPDQVIVNEYLPGQGIAPHIDCEPCFGEVIASLSLGSACTMEFRNIASGEEIAQRLEPRSLLVLRGEARFGWTHGIPARKSDKVDGEPVPRGRRLSLTFRTVIRSA